MHRPIGSIWRSKTVSNIVVRVIEHRRAELNVTQRIVDGNKPGLRLVFRLDDDQWINLSDDSKIVCL